MTEGNVEAARPPRRASTRRRPRPPARIPYGLGSVIEGIERIGLGPLLLLGLAYVGHTTVVQPIANEYRDAIRAVAASCDSLEKELAANDAEDGKRVIMLTNNQERILRALDRLYFAVTGKVSGVTLPADDDAVPPEVVP